MSSMNPRSRSFVLGVMVWEKGNAEPLRVSMERKKWRESLQYFLQMSKICSARTKVAKNIQGVTYLLCIWVWCYWLTFSGSCALSCVGHGFALLILPILRERSLGLWDICVGLGGQQELLNRTERTGSCINSTCKCGAIHALLKCWATIAEEKTEKSLARWFGEMNG